MADHDRHDALLIAGLLDRDQTVEAARAAHALVAECGECASLHEELLALAAATRALPDPARPRDFRLRPSDAARLRPNRLRRLLGLFGTTPATVGRPLGAGLAAIGLVGILVGTAPALLPASGGGAEAGTTLAQPASAPTEDAIQLQGEGDTGREAPPDEPMALDGVVAPTALNVPLVAGSLVLFLVGLVVVVAAGRRSTGRGNRAPPTAV